MIEVGDTVLYHFTSYVRHGSDEREIRTRPAIVTSIEPDTRHLGPANAPVRQILNLHVFFEDRDFVTDRQRDVAAAGMLRVFQRTQVPPADGVPADHRWSGLHRKREAPAPPSWQIPELR